jgi:hypothetical protein
MRTSRNITIVDGQSTARNVLLKPGAVSPATVHASSSTPRRFNALSRRNDKKFSGNTDSSDSHSEYVKNMMNVSSTVPKQGESGNIYVPVDRINDCRTGTQDFSGQKAIGKLQLKPRRIIQHAANSINLPDNTSKIPRLSSAWSEQQQFSRFDRLQMNCQMNSSLNSPLTYSKHLSDFPMATDFHNFLGRQRSAVQVSEVPIISQNDVLQQSNSTTKLTGTKNSVPITSKKSGTARNISLRRRGKLANESFNGSPENEDERKYWMAKLSAESINCKLLTPVSEGISNTTESSNLRSAKCKSNKVRDSRYGVAATQWSLLPDTTKLTESCVTQSNHCDTHNAQDDSFIAKDSLVANENIINGSTNNCRTAMKREKHILHPVLPSFTNKQPLLSFESQTSLRMKPIDTAASSRCKNLATRSQWSRIMTNDYRIMSTPQESSSCESIFVGGLQKQLTSDLNHDGSIKFTNGMLQTNYRERGGCLSKSGMFEPERFDSYNKPLNSAQNPITAERSSQEQGKHRVQFEMKMDGKSFPVQSCCEFGDERNSTEYESSHDWETGIPEIIDSSADEVKAQNQTDVSCSLAVSEGLCANYGTADNASGAKKVMRTETMFSCDGSRRGLNTRIHGSSIPLNRTISTIVTASAETATKSKRFMQVLTSNSRPVTAKQNTKLPRIVQNCRSPPDATQLLQQCSCLLVNMVRPLPAARIPYCKAGFQYIVSISRLETYASFTDVFSLVTVSSKQQRYLPCIYTLHAENWMSVSHMIESLHSNIAEIYPDTTMCYLTSTSSSLYRPLLSVTTQTAGATSIHVKSSLQQLLSDSYPTLLLRLVQLLYLQQTQLKSVAGSKTSATKDTNISKVC